MADGNWVVRPDEVNVDIRIGKDAAEHLSDAVKERLNGLLETMQAYDSQPAQDFYCPKVTVEECGVLIICTGVQGW